MKEIAALLFVFGAFFVIFYNHAKADDYVGTEVECRDQVAADQAESILSSHKPQLLLYFVQNEMFNCKIHTPNLYFDAEGMVPQTSFQTEMYNGTTVDIYAAGGSFWFVPRGYQEWNSAPQGIQGSDVGSTHEH